MELKNDALEDDVPFPRAVFQVPCQFSGVYIEKTPHILDVPLEARING